MVHEKFDCRFFIYDFNSGNFLGYKSNIFWELDKVNYKRHSKEHMGVDGHLIADLLSNLNESGIEKLAYHVFAERIDLNGSSIEILGRYKISQNDSGKFIAEEDNPVILE